MTDDIVPKLEERIVEEFHRLYDDSEKIQTLLQKVKDGTATYQEAHAYATEVHRITGQAWQKYVTADTLPDGRMYYNIANRLIPATLDENFILVSDYAVEAQNKLNRKAEIGLRAQLPERNQDRIDGLVEVASNAEQYAEIEGRLLSGMENFLLNVVDESIRANAEFQYSAGLRPKIIRTTHSGACPWCVALAGAYDYPNVPRDVYRRHDNCYCKVDFVPSKGNRQSVHSGQEGKRRYVLNQYGGYTLSRDARIARAEEMKKTEAERKAIAREKRIATWKKKNQNT